MFRASVRLALCLLLLCPAVSLMAQQPSSVDSVVPSMVKFTGTLSDINGKPLTGIQGVTFLLYKEETGGAPLWMETENVQADKNGHYSVMLGSATAHGLPADVFVDGEARWLAVQVSGQTEQSRTMLMSVPYALKAADAETLGGKPLSAFQLAPEPNSSGAATKNAQTNPPAIEQANELACSSTTACKTGFVPLFTTNGGSAKVGDSIVRQSGTTINIAGSQTVNGGITSGGIITATSAASSPTILGTSTGTAGASIGVEGVTNAGSYAVAGVNNSSTNGIGVYGLSSGTLGDSAGVWGTSQTGYAPGVEGVNTSTDPNATGIYGYANSYGIEGSSPAVGIRGYSSGTGAAAHAVEGITFGNATGFYTDSNVQQARTMGGWVKAMVKVNGWVPPYNIIRCFNSMLTGPAATTPPCGINFTEEAFGHWDFDFGFEVDDRFISATLENTPLDFPVMIIATPTNPAPSNVVRVVVYKDNNVTGEASIFDLFVY